MNKTPVTRLSRTKAGSLSPVESWHGGGDIEIRQYARSLQNAAQTLVGKLELDRTARTEWDTAPVVLLYRQALEINLKLLVGGQQLPAVAHRSDLAVHYPFPVLAGTDR